MKEIEGLERFVEAQRSTYELALGEIKKGRKQGHWMWFIFPQIQGLALSETSRLYAIKDVHEARAFLQHALLGPRFIKICTVLLDLPSNDAREIFGYPDDLKLRSSMTLFAEAGNGNQVFGDVLLKYFDGKKDSTTLSIIVG